MRSTSQCEGDGFESLMEFGGERAWLPAILTFLAPAVRCNQRCPECIITEVLREPVRKFLLAPTDFSKFLKQFIDAEVVVSSVGFTGYEPTLPESWPYVETVFQLAQRHGIRRSLVTNGMLLDRRVERIRQLDVQSVNVSLDGASPCVNDAIRGLSGAFSATIASVRRYVSNAPELAERLGVTSTLYTETNYQSLLNLPALLHDLGVRRWALSAALTERNGERFIPPAATRRRWFRELAAAADAYGIAAYVVEAPGPFEGTEDVPTVEIEPTHALFRIDPAGYVRSQEQLLEVFDPTLGVRWDPSVDDAVEVSGYRSRARFSR